MSKLSSCHHCGGFLPTGTNTCPHCSTAVPSSSFGLNRFARFLMASTAGSAFCLTLMACYGAPPCDEEGTDADNDGYEEEGLCTQVDCNDEDDTIYPGAEEIAGDNIDSNCDGEDDPIELDDDAGVSDDDAGVSDDDAGMSQGDAGM